LNLGSLIPKAPNGKSSRYSSSTTAGNQAISKAQELLPALVVLDLASRKECMATLLTDQQLRTAGIFALVSKSNATAASALLREAEKPLKEDAA
jgi:hypothetical protein